MATWMLLNPASRSRVTRSQPTHRTVMAVRGCCVDAPVDLTGFEGTLLEDQLRAKLALASEIIRIVDERGWSTRRTQEETGIPHADVSRVRSRQVLFFTLDRLMLMLAKLDRGIEVRIELRVRGKPGR